MSQNLMEQQQNLMDVDAVVELLRIPEGLQVQNRIQHVHCDLVVVLVCRICSRSCSLDVVFEHHQNAKVQVSQSLRRQQMLSLASRAAARAHERPESPGGAKSLVLSSLILPA